MAAQLDPEDIQHFLLTRTPALAARYEFLSFESVPAGRAWLAGLVDKVGTGRSVGTASPDARWVTIAFTCNGLRALGVDDAALATFPEEFRRGMAARAEILGMAGDSGPDRWIGELASPALHAIVILFARDAGARSLRTPTPRLPVDAYRRHGPLGVEPGSAAAVRRRRAGALRLPRPPVSPRHRRNR